MQIPTATPFFLIREELLSQNITDFRKALDELWPNSIIAYSVKTNSLPWILKWMNGHGVYAEVVSDEEYEHAILSGYSEQNIVFNGPIKGTEQVRRALKHGSIVNIDSRREEVLIEKERPYNNGQLGIRVNIDPTIFMEKDVGYQEDGFRFGYSDDNGELLRVIKTLEKVYENRRIGLHVHVNSITRSLRVYRMIAQYTSKIIEKYKLDPPYVDIGGGFFGGVPGKTTPREYIQTIQEEFEKAIDISKVKLIIEPGSAAIGSAVELHTSVVDVKDTKFARIVTTDGSRIHIDPVWLKKSYTYSTNAKKPSINKQVICGYTCMDHDRMMVLENEPELSIGDRIVYQRVGNYTVTLGGAFIKPLPPVYAMVNGEIEVARKKMSIEEYYKMETA